MRGLSRFGWSALLAFAYGGFAIMATDGLAMDDSVNAQSANKIVANPNPKVEAKQQEFAVFKKHCIQCHNSVADPERPGKTRDEWYAIINLMEGHGLQISQEEADMIVDLLYSLRRGIEDTSG